MKKLAVVAALVLFSLSAQAGYVRGSGTASCATYNNQQQSKNIKFGFEMWVLGYLSGINQLSSIDFLLNADPMGIFGAIDLYCSQNPLATVLDATNDVMSQLVARAKK